MKEKLKKTAHLARLAMGDAEIDRLIGNAEKVLEYVKQLNGLNTDSLDPTSHALEQTNAFRVDSVVACANPKEIVKQSPDSKDQLFQVPRVIEESE